MRGLPCARPDCGLTLRHAVHDMSKNYTSVFYHGRDIPTHHYVKSVGERTLVRLKFGSPEAGGMDGSATLYWDDANALGALFIEAVQRSVHKTPPAAVAP